MHARSSTQIQNCSDVPYSREFHTNVGSSTTFIRSTAQPRAVTSVNKTYHGHKPVRVIGWTLTCTSSDGNSPTTCFTWLASKISLKPFRPAHQQTLSPIRSKRSMPPISCACISFMSWMLNRLPSILSSTSGVSAVGNCEQQAIECSLHLKHGKRT